MREVIGDRTVDETDHDRANRTIEVSALDPDAGTGQAVPSWRSRGSGAV